VSKVRTSVLLVLEGDGDAVHAIIQRFIDMARVAGVDVAESWVPEDDDSQDRQ
jgi:hypothetical protein